MRRVSIGIAILLFALGLASNVRADGVTIGVVDDGNCYPFTCNDSGTNVGLAMEYQQVYAANQFSGPMAISGITFFDTLYPGATVLNGDYQIFLSTAAPGVGPGTLGTDAAANEGSDNTLFFSGNLGQTLLGSTFDIAGTTPFIYNPVNGNLLMDVLVSNQDNVPSGFGGGFLDADDSGAVTSRAWCGPAGFACPALNPDTAGLVTEFTSVPEPSSLLLLGSGLSLLLGLKGKRKEA
jgi:hypothetical protein